MMKVLLWVGLWSGCAWALDPNKAVTQYVHDAWRKEQGLPQSNVLSVFQGRDGYIWTSSFEGIARFDGVRFTQFRKADTPELPSDNVRGFYEDRAGNLWIVPALGGLTVYRDGKFRLYGEKDGLPAVSLVDYDLAEDGDGNLWLRTLRGLVRFRDGRWTMLTVKDGLPSDRLLTMVPDGSGGLWVGTWQGLSRWQGGRFVNYTTADGLPDNVVGSLAMDRKGVLWMGTGKGVAKYEGGKFTSYGAAEGLPNEAVLEVLPDRSGGVWVGTRFGLARLEGGKARRFPTDRNNTPTRAIQMLEDRDGVVWIGADEGLFRYTEASGFTIVEHEGLFRHVVTTMREDKEGSVWIGTRAGGLHRLRDGKFTTWGTSEGLPSNVIYPVMEDGDGSMWIGTGGGGLAHVEKGKVTRYDIRNGLMNNIVRSLSRDREGTLWIGLATRGLHQLRGGKVSTPLFRETFGDWGYLAIYAFLEDRAGSWWLASFGGGLGRIRDGRITVFGRKDGMMSERVIALDETRDGTLWFSTDDMGLGFYKDGKFGAYRSKDGLASDTTYGLYEDGEGALWISGNHGLTRRQNGKFFVWSVAQGIQGSIFQIFEDGRGNLWLGTSQGIVRVKKAELQAVAEGRKSRVEARVFTTGDGMRSSECNTPARGLKARDGKLWFPTLNGVVVVDPEKVAHNAEPPQVFVEELVVNEQRLGNAAGGVVLAAGSDKLEFHYTALSLLAPEQVKFKYKLVGYDREWVEADTRRTAYYTNLWPGSYEFQVIACNNDGVWNETGARMKFRLEPRFYQAWWFYGLCVGGLVLSGVGLNNVRTKHLLAREREKTQLKFAELRLEKAQMEAEVLEAERQRQAKELEEARQLQLSMLPKQLPELPHVEIAAFMKTATEVGGDYYDFHLGEDRTLTVVVGDATGHGLKAGTLVASVKSLFVSLGPQGDIAEIFGRMSRVLKAMKLRGLFMAMTMVKVSGHQVRVSIAGMPAVLIYRAGRGEVEEVRMRALPLGGMAKYAYEEWEFAVGEGDVVVMMSDGLPERFNVRDEMLGYERVAEALAGMAGGTAEEVIGELVRMGNEWSEGRAAHDDETFVVLKFRGAMG